MRGKAFKSLNEGEGILDLFEFFERLQVIVDMNEILWALTKPNNELFQIPYHSFVHLTCTK